MFNILYYLTDHSPRNDVDFRLLSEDADFRALSFIYRRNVEMLCCFSESHFIHPLG